MKQIPIIILMIVIPTAWAESSAVNCVAKMSSNDPKSEFDFIEKNLEVGINSNGIFTASTKIENCYFSVQTVNGRRYSTSVLETPAYIGASAHTGFDADNSLITSYVGPDLVCMLICKKP